MFSKSCEYGIRATLYIASKSELNIRVGLKDIAKEANSPESFTAKVLQTLTRAKVVGSIKGPNGGFYIDKDNLSKIRLIDIVDAIDGDKIFNGCGLGLEECNAKMPCPMHDHFLGIREDLKKMLKETSLDQLRKNLSRGETFLKR